jgi:lipoprotein-anchoring transpeptidase ErfK/SrfK
MKKRTTRVNALILPCTFLFSFLSASCGNGKEKRGTGDTNASEHRKALARVQKPTAQIRAYSIAILDERQMPAIMPEQVKPLASPVIPSADAKPSEIKPPPFPSPPPAIPAPSPIVQPPTPKASEIKSEPPKTEKLIEPATVPPLAPPSEVTSVPEKAGAPLLPEATQDMTTVPMPTPPLPPKMPSITPIPDVKPPQNMSETTTVEVEEQRVEFPTPAPPPPSVEKSDETATGKTWKQEGGKAKLVPAPKVQVPLDKKPPKATVVKDEPAKPAKVKTDSPKETGKKKAPNPDKGTGVKIDVDISKQRLTWTKGEESKTCRIITGKEKTPTPTGTFRVASRKGPNHESHEFPGAKMPWMLTLEGKTDDGRNAEDIGFGPHGSTFLFGGDRPMSHGCIRLAEEDARWLRENTPVGAIVRIHGSVKEYLTENRVMPWQLDGFDNAYEPDGNGDYRKKPMSRECADFLFRNLNKKASENKLSLCAKNESNPSLWFVYFPDCPKIGNPRELPNDECRRRFFSYAEVGEAMKVYYNKRVKYIKP